MSRTAEPPKNSPDRADNVPKRLLEIKNLKVSFRTSQGELQALRGVDFHVDAGEILGIVGESGSGKSVTAHSLLQLLPPNARVEADCLEFRGTPLRTSLRGREIAMIFQEPGRSFDPLYSLEKSFRETLRVKDPGMTPQAAQKRALELLEEVGIPSPRERLGNFPHQFSGGMLQRVMIALALAQDPELLLADEPTTALDVTTQARILELLGRLRRTRGLALVFITHNLALVSRFADRILVLYSGLALEEGPAGEVLTRPRHPYTRGLLDSLIRFGEHHSTKPLRILPGTVPNPLAPPPGCPFAPRCRQVHEACLQAVPPLVAEGASGHRCLVPGVKS